MTTLLGNRPLSLIIAIAIPFVGALPATMATQPQLKKDGWYQSLKKPSWTPPNYLFPPVWTFLYASMGYASFRIYDVISESPSIDPTLPLALYATQLGLNWVWSPVFFGMHRADLGGVIILGLLGTITATAVEFHKIDETAGLLMIPYIAWVSLASALNLSIWYNNPTTTKKSK
ncbi:hypothetical protein SmJEL517_g03223 [Synchytrium microbalum]|uniref:Tryptophan-rich sensory protein n=1 Tax=Synchytrium microbalum TaxID=1806994 RepID=A0A507C7M6_9FUNG|nr:uncharacterized protein SmJEL517_g03223 [Synchytrium microbalum]TPX33996.1 hypothetical protein SmJEL517_g03223 [Synchytrium microbalum]